MTSSEPQRRAGKGARTLVACSGGADSVALAVALHAAGAPMVLGHVVHDLRPAADALADRDSVRALATRLGVPFLEASVRVPRGRGVNAESEARRLRYDALATMAQASGIRFVATAHHADDQLESVLMALLRGAGPRGLGGMRVSRVLRRASVGKKADGGVILIRPMLHHDACVTRGEAESLCRAAGHTWQVDQTNADVSRLRAAVRSRVVPVLVDIRPSVRQRAATTAALMQGADHVVRRQAQRVLSAATLEDRTLTWARSRLRHVSHTVLGEALRGAHRSIAGAVGLDTAGARPISQVVRAVRDRSTDPRRFTLGNVVVLVDARRVRVSPRAPRRHR